MNRSKLGVHILVRYDESLLERCLKSVKPLVDEIILITSTSVANTDRLQQVPGASVLSGEWQDDWSIGRNMALEIASTEWVLCLDADEKVVIDTDDVSKYLIDTQVPFFRVKVSHIIGKCPDDRVIRYENRLIRKGIGKFDGRLCERFVCQSELYFADVDVPIVPMRLEQSFNRSEDDRNIKLSDNLRLLELALNDTPGNPAFLHMQGRTYMQMGKAPEAMACFTRAMERLPENAPFRHEFVRDYAALYCQSEQWEAASDFIVKELQRYSDHPSLYHLLGESLENLGFLEEALTAYRNAISCRTTADKYACNEGAGGYLSSYRAAFIFGKLGQTEWAERHYMDCLDECPSFEPALCGIAEQWHRQGMNVEAIIYRLEQWIPVDSGGELLAKVMTCIGADGHAITILSQSDRLLSAHGSLLLALALLKTGRPAEAAAILMPLLHKAGSNKETYRDQMLCFMAVACWSDLASLPSSVYEHIPLELRTAYEQIEGVVLKGEAFIQWDIDSSLLYILHQLIDCAALSGVPNIALRLSGLNRDLILYTAKCLYRNNYVRLSIDGLLSCYMARNIDDEGLLMLAEYCYDRGYYYRSASLFESVNESSALHSRAMIGATLSYLRQAEIVCLRQRLLKPDDEESIAVLQRIEICVGKLRYANWRTESNREGEERMCRNA